MIDEDKLNALELFGENEYLHKEIERLNDIIDKIDEILKEHINECRVELNSIIKSDDLDYINECSREFDVIRKNIEMIIEKINEVRYGVEEE